MHEPPEDLDWKPARSGGALFGTHRARFTPERVEFEPSGGSRALLGVIAFSGVATLLGSGGYYLAKDDVGALVVGGVMLVTSLVLVIMLRQLLLNYRVFDRQLGVYWDTRDGGDRLRPGPKPLPLAEIRGLQILREHVSGGDADFDSDELNLVLREPGTRINVVDHGDARGQRSDAEQLAAWLSVPLWISSGAQRLPPA